MVDHHEVGRFRLGPRAMDVAVLLGAMNADAVERVARDSVPQHLFFAVQAQLGTIAAFGRVQPHEDLELEHQLIRVVARLDQVAAPPAKRDVVRASLEQDRLEVPWEPLAQAGQVLAHQLLLQRVRVGRNHDAFVVPDGACDRGHQVGEALACPGAGFDHQCSAARLDLSDREQHLHLRLAMLVAGQEAGQRTFGSKEGGDRSRILGRRRSGAAPAGSFHAHRGQRFGVRAGRGQRVGEEARHRPLVWRHQRQHRLLQAFVEPPRLLAKAEQELPRCIRVVQGAVRPGLVETHLGRQEGQAVAGRRGQQDAGDVQCVEDLLRGVPQPGRIEEVDVQPGAMPNRLAAADELGQPAQGRLGAGRAAQLLLPDARQAQDRVGHGPPGIDQLLESRGDLARREGDGADFDDSVSGRVETGGLEVKGDVLRQGFSDITNHRIPAPPWRPGSSRPRPCL